MVLFSMIVHLYGIYQQVSAKEGRPEFGIDPHYYIVILSNA